MLYDCYYNYCLSINLYVYDVFLAKRNVLCGIWVKSKFQRDSVMSLFLAHIPTHISGITSWLTSQVYQFIKNPVNHLDFMQMYYGKLRTTQTPSPAGWSLRFISYQKYNVWIVCRFKTCYGKPRITQNTSNITGICLVESCLLSFICLEQTLA